MTSFDSCTESWKVKAFKCSKHHFISSKPNSFSSTTQNGAHETILLSQRCQPTNKMFLSQAKILPSCYAIFYVSDFPQFALMDTSVEETIPLERDKILKINTLHN